MSNELMVRIQDFDTPISVSKMINGVEVGKREVLVDDYIRSLIGSLNDEELLGYLMHENFLETVQTYLTREVDEDIYNEIFKLFINNSNEFTDTDIKKHEQFTKLITILLEKVNVKEVNENLLEDLLKNIFLNVKSADLKDMAAYNKLFRVLLEKIDIHKGSSIVIRDFMSRILDKMNNTKNEEDLKAIFDVIVEKGAKRDWLEKVISDRKPHTSFQKTPILPAGTVFYKESIGGLKTIIMEVPKHQRDVEFKQLQYKSVGHPNLLVRP
ncbi:hypothetical protein QTG56_23710 (plasmid) [Rossellomorea sp. AcN35-11]|nr:hypothetical protein [Rossellomorea aquimaris]WJV32369.1 hypothetical protein QTG56_23710 [Rossellomorea sp. AcN35-11]